MNCKLPFSREPFNRLIDAITVAVADSTAPVVDSLELDLSTIGNFREKSMEFLSIEGALRLKKDASEELLTRVTNGLNYIQFVTRGSVVVDRYDDLIDIDAEGEISSDTSKTVLSLLKTLNSLTTDHSIIVINRVRWEINVILKHKVDDIEPLDTLLSQFLSSHENNQLVLT